MEPAPTPLLRLSLSDDLAQRVMRMIQGGTYQAGDRLPAIAMLARDFGVGSPTVREALKKLETVGVVSIRHGSGVYVNRTPDNLVISNPLHPGAVSKKLLTDLIEARIPIEVQSATLAAAHATPEHLAELRELLARAGASLDDDALLNTTNLAFHRGIARASGNTVLRQLLEVLSSLFRQEQRLILGIHGSRRQDHAEHLAIFEALERRDEALAAQRMREHLEGVRDVLLRWDPDAHPVP
jgi:GntR family transcriptional regulator, transcriptional repressor for pyruvate dehydrogenase complex